MPMWYNVRNNSGNGEEGSIVLRRISPSGGTIDSNMVVIIINGRKANTNEQYCHRHRPTTTPLHRRMHQKSYNGRHLGGKMRHYQWLRPSSKSRVMSNHTSKDTPLKLTHSNTAHGDGYSSGWQTASKNVTLERWNSSATLATGMFTTGWLTMCWWKI